MIIIITREWGFARSCVLSRRCSVQAQRRSCAVCSRPNAWSSSLCRSQPGRPRGFSRSEVILRAYRLADANVSDDELPNEDWLTRLEKGQLVKPSRALLEAICQALECTAHQRVRILTLGTGSVLGSDPLSEMLNDVVDIIQREAREPLESLVGQRRVHTLDAHELRILTVKALTLALRQLEAE